MREHKYRGRIDDSGDAGEWVYGGIAIHDGRAFIISIKECETCGKECDCKRENFPCYRNAVEVIPETVGQYTGRKDKNDVEIWEGARVRITWDDGETEEYTIMWCDGIPGFCCDNFALLPESEQIEIIHENPELPEKE